MELKFKGINESLVGMSKELLENCVRRSTRGFDCFEINEPIILKVENICDRYITISERKHNKILPFVEVLWILSGVNDLEMPASYVKNLNTYSDDGQFMRAAYSPRIRALTGLNGDYKISEPKFRNVYSGSVNVTDQLKYVIDSFNRDNNSRQLVIEIGDPSKDCFENNGDLKITKDQPCTRLLNFQLRSGKLDLTVYMRSNDHIFGAHGVNLTNFMFIQEILSNLLGVKPGSYYHIANNYHYYDNMSERVEILSKIDLSNESSKEFGEFFYKDKIKDLIHLDFLIEELFEYERSLRLGSNKIIKFEIDMFQDWATVFSNKWLNRKDEFINPYLNKLYGYQVLS